MPLFTIFNNAFALHSCTQAHQQLPPAPLLLLLLLWLTIVT
jgi:hypothetical protein